MEKEFSVEIRTMDGKKHLIFFENLGESLVLYNDIIGQIDNDKKFLKFENSIIMIDKIVSIHLGG